MSHRQFRIAAISACLAALPAAAPAANNPAAYHITKSVTLGSHQPAWHGAG